MIHKTIRERPLQTEVVSQNPNAFQPDVVQIGSLNALRTIGQVAPASGFRKVNPVHLSKDTPLVLNKQLQPVKHENEDSGRNLNRNRGLTAAGDGPQFLTLLATLSRQIRDAADSTRRWMLLTRSKAETLYLDRADQDI